MKSIAWGKKLSSEEKEKLLKICFNLKIEPDYLMACIAFETGETFSSSIESKSGSKACVDVETRILTLEGWKTLYDIAVGDVVKSFNTETLKIENDVIKHITYNLSSDNYYIKGRSIDICCTGDHTWFLRKKYYNRVNISSELVKLSTDAIVDLKSPQLYSFLHPHKRYVDLSDKLTRKAKYTLVLIGMIVGDGTINKQSGRIELVQSIKNTPKRIKTVNHILKTIFPEGVVSDTTKSQDGCMLRWRFTTLQSKELAPYFDWEYNFSLRKSRVVKKINPEIIKGITPVAAKCLLSGYLFSDGHFCKRNKTISFCNSERAIIDDFMTLAVLCGRNPREVQALKRGGTKSIFPNGKTYYVNDKYTVYLRRFKYTSATKNQLKIMHSDKKQLMWCPTTNNGTWIALRGGTVYITGNCGLIQFMPTTAIALGTTSEKLKKMSVLEQLDYVEKYFKPYARKIKTLSDLYMAILWPAAIGKSSDFVLFDKSDKKYPKRYIQNRGLDFNKDGKITLGETCKKIEEKLVKGRTKEFFG